jgi:RHS repeat-associated protein
MSARSLSHPSRRGITCGLAIVAMSLACATSGVAQTPPSASITPGANSYPVGTQLQVHVEFQSYGSCFDAAGSVFLNGSFIGSTNGGSCDFQSGDFTITIAEGANTVSATASDGFGTAYAEVTYTGTAPYSVSVTPDGSAEPARPANTTGHTAVFTVRNTGGIADTYGFVCSSTGPVTCANVNPSSVALGAGSQTTVTVTYSVGSPGSGTIRLTATGSASDEGHYTVAVQAYGVAVTPDGAVAPNRWQNTSGHSATFTVQNTGTTTNTFSFTCSGSGGVTCGTPPSPLAINAGATVNVSMPYSVGSPGTGTLTVTATGTNATNAGSYTVPILTVLSSVSGGSFTKDSRYLLQETAVGYDAYGRITQLTDARGKASTFEYGGNVNNAFLVRVIRFHDATGPIDHVTRIAYNSDGLVDTIVDPSGSRRHFTYDLFGRLTRVRNTQAQLVRAYGYSYSRTLGNNWVFQPGSPNAIVDTTFMQPDTAISTGYFDGLGRPIQTVAREGAASYVVAAQQYDVMGRDWRVWQPYSRAVAGYDAAFATNATAWHTSDQGAAATPYRQTSYRPDGLGRVSAVAPEFVGAAPNAARTTYGIEIAGSLFVTTATDESDMRTTTVRDVAGNVVRTVLGTAPESSVTTFTYDVLGRRLTATDPRGLITSFTYNTRGLLTARTSPDAGTVSTKYDAAGNIRFSQDANQAAAGQVYFANYDFAGRPLIQGVGSASFAVVNPDITEAVETSQSNWLVVRAYDAKPSTGLFPWNLFSAQITPLALTNVAGRLAAVASKSGAAWQVTLFSYDADGQVTARYVFTQNNAGSGVWTALNTTVTYERDLRGRETKRTLTVGGNSFYHWYEYNTRGLLWRLFSASVNTKPSTPDVTDTYRPGGQPASYQFAGGPPVPIRYTVRGQTERIGDPATTTYPFSALYTYLPNGLVQAADFYNAGSPAAQKRYGYVFQYDGLRRLRGADHSAWNGSAWVTTSAYDLPLINYDPAGNITRLVRNRENGTTVDDLTYTMAPTSNRLASISDPTGATPETWDAETGTFTYDANGNVRSAPAPYSFTAGGTNYNYQNLPLTISRSGNPDINFRYDDAGQRIARRVGSLTQPTDVYIREGAATLAVFTVNGSGSPTAWQFNLVWDSRTVGRQANTGPRSYYHFDAIGSVRAVTQGMTVVESYDYDPWGLLMPGRSLTGATRERFSGKEFDAESGLAYFGARYYMLAFGRWAAVDPLADWTPGWSAYTYVLNNPISLVDPDGRQANCNETCNEWLRREFEELKRRVVDRIRASDQARRERWAREALCDCIIPTGDEALLIPFVGAAANASSKTVASLAARRTTVRVATATTARRAATSVADDLAAAAGRAEARVGAGRGPVHGTRVHREFQDEVEALANPNLHTEVSYLNGRIVDRGTAGSVRVDVVQGASPSAPTALYDLKTGGARLTEARVRQIQSHVPGGTSVPVYEIRVP